jgi:hypothetical protein
VRLALLALGLAVAALAAGCGGDEGPGPPVRPDAVAAPRRAADNPYAPRFAFKQRIPANPALDPRSTAIVGRFVENAAEQRMTLSHLQDVPPVYVARASDPLYRIESPSLTTRFRVPAEAQPGGGQDEPLVLLDPRAPQGRQVELRMYRADVDHAARVIRAEGAGLFHYNNDRARLNPDGSASVSLPIAGQGTGSELSILAGLIRPEEVRRGGIHHALRLAYSNIDSSNRFRPPAARTDQPLGVATRTPAAAMDMGMRLQLDPEVDCDLRTVPGAANDSTETRFLRLVCHALQDYGMIMADGSGPRAIVIEMEHDATAGWESIIGPAPNGSYGFVARDEHTPDDELDRDASDGIPWNRLRVLARSEFGRGGAGS